MKVIRCAALFLASLTLLASGVFGSVEKSYAASSLTLGRKLSSVSSKSGKKSGKGTSSKTSKKSKSGKKSHGKKGSSKGAVTPSPVQVAPSPVQVTPSPVQITPSPVQVTAFPDDYVDGVFDENFILTPPTGTLFNAVAAYVIDKDMWSRSFDCGDGKVTPTSCGERYGFPINNWDVSRITKFDRLFGDIGRIFDDTGAPFEGPYSNFNEEIGNWDVSSSISFTSMFSSNAVFNQNISGWNVSSAIGFESMFDGATAFNQNIGEWNVSNARALGFMFLEAKAFNQDLSAWDLTNVTADSFGMFTRSGMPCTGDGSVYPAGCTLLNDCRNDIEWCPAR